MAECTLGQSPKTHKSGATPTYRLHFFETSTNGWWWASTAGRGEQGLRDREREGERGRRRVRQVRTCALAICPARSACPIVRRRRRERANHPEPSHSTILPNAPRGRKISLAWTNFSSHGRYLESRTRGLQSGWEGQGWGSGAREPRRFFPPPMLQRFAWSLAAAKLLHACFCHRCGVRSTQEMILGSTGPQCACSCQLCCPRCR